MHLNVCKCRSTRAEEIAKNKVTERIGNVIGKVTQDKVRLNDTGIAECGVGII